MSFIDFAKAFGNVLCPSLWYIQHVYGIPNMVVQAMQQFYA